MSTQNIKTGQSHGQTTGRNGQSLTGRINGLSEIAGRYDLVLCDVWGVLHNGVLARPGAIAALSSFRADGGTVVMITNAPRQRKSVRLQLANMDVPEETFDEVVTSGDVTRVLIANM